MTDINTELRSLEEMIDRSFRVASVYLSPRERNEVQQRTEMTYSRVRTAGEVKFVKDWEQADSSRRNFDGEGWNPDPKSKKILAKALWSLAMAFGHIHTGYRIFSKIRASNLSPDGLMGGRGYIKSIRDMRAKLSEAVEILSDVTDTIHDDLNGPQWEARAQDPETQTLMNEAQHVLENPADTHETEDSSSVAEGVDAEGDAAAAAGPDMSGPDDGLEKEASRSERIANRIASRVADDSWTNPWTYREHQYGPMTEPSLDTPVNNWSSAFGEGMSDKPLSDRFEEDVYLTDDFGIGPRDDGTNPRTF